MTMKRSVRTALLSVTVALMSSLVRAETPNVLLIYTDDQGYGDVSCMNPESKFETPNLDRLAREGIVFTDAHCSDTVCTPSRYGLLTGRYSWRTELKRGVLGAERACLIADDRMNLASLLKSKGYATWIVGKWHLGMDFPGEEPTAERPESRDWSQPVRDMPLDKGFDYFFGIPASMNFGVLAYFEGRHAAVPPTMFTEKKPSDLALSDFRFMPPYESAPAPGLIEIAPDFVDEECLHRLTDKALELIENHAVKSEQTPFFLYLPFTSPHKPVVPRPEFRGKGQAGGYGELMMETDWQIGRILQLLEDRKLADSTLVIVTSDNGPETTWKERNERYQHASNGIYRDGKRSVYEGGHRVPFIVRWPEKITGGRTSDALICQTDVLATIAEIVDVELLANAGEDSQSFLRILLDESHRHKRVPVIHHGASGRFAIRDGDWKLVMPEKRLQRELYNLNDDPGETADVIELHPMIAERLEAEITKIVQDGRSTPGIPQPNDTPAWDDLTWMAQDEF